MDTMEKQEGKSRWHEARARARSNMERNADSRASLRLQGQRIAAYLPTLYRQQEEAVRRLAGLDQLIADEEAAVEAIEKHVA